MHKRIKVFPIVIAITFSWAMAVAQSSAGSNSETGIRTVAASGQAGESTDLPASTEMRATLDTPLSSKTSKPGDRFTATVSQSVSGNNGEVVIPAGARVEGEVSEVDQSKAQTSLRGKGTLNLRFRDVVLPSGQTLPLVSSLVSVNNTNGLYLQRSENEGRVESGNEGKSATAEEGGGANAPQKPSFGRPLKGLAVGNLAGGGYILAITGSHVDLPAQTGMVIRLEEGLRTR
jgi:hypothetical protein